jgi:YcaO-like protein with predicted kinase domain
MLPLELNIVGQPALRGRTLKTYVRGTHRMIPPDETLASLKPLIPKMGKVSAAMESIEGYHAERVTGPLQLASYDELRQTDTVVDPLRLPLSTIRPFQTTLPLLWIAGDDWLRHERVWVPSQLVHTAYTTRMRWDLVGFAASSTGLASGNHVLEAVSHALCEIVERDATARFAARPEEERDARRLDLRTVRF